MDNTGLPSLDWPPNVRHFWVQLGGLLYPADRFVQEVLAAIERNEDVIVLPKPARIIAKLGMDLPSVINNITHKVLAHVRADRLVPSK